MTELIKVLDHGYVKLIDSMGSEETIIEAARMSTGRGFERWDAGDFCTICGFRREIAESKPIASYCSSDSPHEWKTSPGDQKLLAFLYSNGHLTPFEMCELHLEIQAPIMVFREWHRHRTQSFNEASARYFQMPNLHYLPELERFQKQSATNRQGSAEVIDPGEAETLQQALGDEQSSIYSEYEHMLNLGLAKEIARLNTPVSRYSKMRAKTDLRNWLGFLNLRMRENAQWEIRQYANAVSEIVKQIWPRTHALFLEHELNGVRLSATELKKLRNLIQSGAISDSQVDEIGLGSIFTKLTGG